MSLYGQYVKERENINVIETEGGFVSYFISKNFIFIKDLYVIPELRMTGIASGLADEVAEIGLDAGCTKMSCTVAIDTNNATESLKASLSYGFKLDSLDSANNLIYLSKEI